MKLRFIVFLQLLSFVFPVNVYADDVASNPLALSNYTVNTFPLMGALPSYNTYRVFQDKEGIIWFGTNDGVCRYDGYQLNVFRSGIMNATKMTNNDVLAINENDRYYFFGSRKGLNVLDKQTYQMFSLPFKDLDHDEVRAIEVDDDGNAWIGTKIRLIRLSSNLKKCERMDSLGVPGTSVNSVYKDAEGNILVTFWCKGLYIYNKVKDRFEKMSQVGVQDNPFAIQQLGENQYIVSTWGDGLYRISMLANRKVAVAPITVDGYKPERLKVVYGIAKSKLFWLIGEQGLYVAQWQNGVLHSLDDTSLSHTIGNYVNKVNCDNNGNIWVSGSFRALYRISLEKEPWQEYTMPSLASLISSEPELNSLCVDAQGNIWFGETMLGLGVQTVDGHVRLWKDIPALRGIDNMKDVVYMGRVASAPDEIWVAPRYDDAQIYRLQCKGGVVNVLGKFDCKASHQGNILYFTEDAARNLWIATDRGVIIRTFNGRLQELKNTPQDVNSIAFTPDGRAWLASAGSGMKVVSYRLENGKVNIEKMENVDSEKSLLPTPNMAGVCFDKYHGKLWVVSTEGNLVAYNLKTKKNENYTKYFESYISSAVQDILMDKQGNLWIVTYNRLLKFNPNNLKVNIYSSEDGLNVLAFLKHACFVSSSKDNELYFAGKGGAVCINADALLYANHQHSLPIVSDVKVGGTSIWMGTFDDAYSLDAHERLVKLDFDAQNIEIDFTTCNYVNPSKIIFAYKLEGVDDDWNYTTAGKMYAYYNSLSKGNHKLLVKATDANGVWGKDVVTYTIYRAPAFYETWWAYTLYVLLALATLAFAFFRTRHRLKMSEALRIARIEKQKEEELTQSKLRYFTNVSHDFLTPITVISCIIDDMKMTASAQYSAGKGATAQSQQLSLDRIRVNLMKLKQLIQQVLDFRKMENGKMHLEVGEGDLVAFVRQLCNNSFLPMMQKKGLDFEFASPLTPIKGYFDADKLEKIVTNLFSNAYKYTEHGKITVALERQDDLAVLKVKDTGKGMSKEAVSHIFERFYTVNEQRSDSNGIGLSLVKELVSLHHAKIQVESQLGEGTTFTIVLPINKESYSDEEMAKHETEADKLELQLPKGKTIEDILKAEAEGQSPVNLPGTDAFDANQKDSELASVDKSLADDKRLLIVEDNAELRGLMVRIFARYHQVDCAEDGAEALKKIQENEPDIIISDVMMPVMDGLELCRKLKNDINTSHIPLILLTARNTPEDRVECYEAGADGYIAKPFELPVLKARIDNFLRLRQERQEAFRKTLIKEEASPSTAPSTLTSSLVPNAPERQDVSSEVFEISSQTDEKVKLEGIVSTNKSEPVVSTEANSGLDKLEMSALDKKALDKALKLIDEHLNDEYFNVDVMADAMFMSKSSLYRKIKSLTGLSPVEFIRNIRLKRAYQMLQEEDVTITDVAYACGFSTPRYFSTCFKTEFGITPTEFKKQ